MKTLYLIRHAKASWDQQDLTDFDRPLTELGKTHAHDIGKQLQAQNIKPDLIISSPAVRAMTTAEIIAEELKYPVDKIVKNQQIYTGGVEELLEIIQSIKPVHKNVLFFGHNPSLTWLMHFLCEDARMNIPTCGVVAIELGMRNWQDLTEAEGRVVTFLHPPHHETA